ncbi:hypothetical protein ACIBG8_28585 [Nonomuraea sp. NPDC050556]|uniref:hypothetical protein n=1 Tax=Nonomuraea sp. NPDC050556 TaxID=3364369 RepID=UPI00379E5C46
MDEHAAVRELLAAPPPSPEAIAAWREQLMTEVNAAEGRGRRRTAVWTSALTGLLGAAAAVVMLLTSTPAQHTTQHTARDILLAAATEAAKAPDQGSWWGVRLVKGSQYRDPGDRYLLERRRTEETWIPADPEGSTWIAQQELGVEPVTPQDEAAWRADGSPATWTYKAGKPGEWYLDAAPGKVELSQTEDWDWRVVASGKPLTGIGQITPEELRGLLGEEQTAMRAAEVVAYYPVSAEVRAAAYRLLASLSGVSAAGKATDRLGRTGEAVEYPGAQTDTTERLIIDPATGAALSIETRTKGLLTDFTLVQESHWADSNPLKKENR